MSKRVRYFLGHLAISIVVSLCAVLWVFFVWYPNPFAQAVGLTGIFLMMVAIDVIIGPLLSLIVYKEGKKTLKMDLAVIAVLQVLALGYGLYNIAEGRPVWVVYNVDRFELVRNNEIYDADIKKAEPEYRQAGWLKPRYVATAFASDAKERGENTLDEVLAGISIAQRPERYVPLDSAQDSIRQRTLSFDTLKEYNAPNQVENVIQKYPTAVGFVPLKATATDMTVLVDKEGHVVEIVDLRPWK